MKTTLDLRPVHHRKEDRIRAHVLLCWLALLLIRIAENQAGDTWRNLRDELQRMHLGTFTGTAGTSRQRTELTASQREILRALGVAQPPQFLHLAAPEPASSQQPRGAETGHESLDTRRTYVRRGKTPAHNQFLASSTSN